MDSLKKDSAEGPIVEYGTLVGDAALLEACFEVFRRFELKEQLDALLERAREWSGARSGVAYGPAEEKDVFRPLARSRPLEEWDPDGVTAVEGGRLRNWVGDSPQISDGSGAYAEIVRCWPGRPPQSTLAIPIRDDPGPLAVVLLLAFDEAPSRAVLARLEQLVSCVRPALHNGLQVLSMRELVIKDDTAECFNRRYFETTLPAELARASRFHSALSLIFLDMDNLKEVNKRYGHAMGSRTLFEVSHRIRARIRRFDKLFRFGGDEFCIVLPETEWHGALEVAERVRDAIAGREFLTRELGDSRGARMTASLGIASFPLHARTQKELIEHADRAMQRIKNATKNSIGIAEIVGGSHGR